MNNWKIDQNFFIHWFLDYQKYCKQTMVPMPYNRGANAIIATLPNAGKPLLCEREQIRNSVKMKRLLVRSSNLQTNQAKGEAVGYSKWDNLRFRFRNHFIFKSATSSIGRQLEKLRVHIKKRSARAHCNNCSDPGAPVSSADYGAICSGG
jgi:hypothetical protein